ncbi:MAG: nucleotide sugar dehydrogenase [Oligoflexia bacterium]|nr:nucleotide sugar dehydrogenase [Oligoflexia bacterium]
MGTKIGVIGLGYVGLPIALALADKFPGTVGFDTNKAKISAIKKGVDPTNEGLAERIQSSSIDVSASPDILRGCNFIVVAVPTPVDQNKQPDFAPLLGACSALGPVLKGGETIVFESTVYPGVTEDICGPAISKASGLRQGKDFKLGYSPERINPGDKEHTLERVKKVVAGEDEQTLNLIAAVYEKIISAGIHRAPSIKVAEAAKVIENTQRDLNIALMNELALIFDRIGISTRDVLDAASTKWNFLRFSPGLVGGHCIGVDPYYLTTKAEQLGYHPEVILAGRRINDNMGKFIAQRMVKMMVNAGIQPKGARVGVLGLTFKEDVADIRNSRVPDIIQELKEFGAVPLVHDPLAQAEETLHEYGLKLNEWSELVNLDGLVLAVSHQNYRSMDIAKLTAGLRKGGVLIDVKSALSKNTLPPHFSYWSL